MASALIEQKIKAMTNRSLESVLWLVFGFISLCGTKRRVLHRSEALIIVYYMRSGTLMPSSDIALRITLATVEASIRRKARVMVFSSLRIEWSW